MKDAKKYSVKIKKAAISFSALIILSLPLTPIINNAQGHADSPGSYVTLSSFSGHPEQSLTVSGGNFVSNEEINISATQNGALEASTSTSANQYGQFSAMINLPAKLAQGSLLITASGQTSGLTSSNSYYVTPFAPSLMANNTETTPYSNVEVSGSGYAPNETVDLNLAGATAIAHSDAAGSFNDVSITSPDVPAASYTLIGVGESSGASATAYEYVNAFYPSASPNSYYVMPGTSLGFNGSGYAPNETVDVSDAATGIQISSFSTDASGDFKNAGSFIVPASYAGLTKKFVLTGTTSNASTTTSTAVGSYYPNVTPASYYVLPGKTVSFDASGFIPGEVVDIYSSNVKIASVNADSKGDLTNAGSITIPSNEAGTNQTFTLTGEQSNGSGTVSVQIGSYNPQASPSSYYAMPGSMLTFDGTGYAPDEVVTVFSGLNTIGSFNTDDNGNFLNSGNINIGYNQANSSASYELQGSVSKQAINFTIGVGQLNTQLTPSSYYVLPYAPFSLTASGFAPNEKVDLKNGTTILATSTSNSLGSAVFNNVSLPYSGLSSANLSATGETSLATANVSVGIGSYNPSVVASNYYAKPGDTISLTGSGFAPNETVNITAGSLTTSVAADINGSFKSNVTLPFGQTKNSLAIVSTGDLSHASSTTTITLAPYLPQVSPSTYYAQPGTPMSFSGSGFAPNEPITISLNGTLIGNESADSKGNLVSTGNYVLPFGKTASYTVNGLISGASDTMNIGLAQFYAGLQLNNYYGDGGSSVIASGSGFAPNENVEISSGSSVLTSVAADAEGNFSTNIVIPYVAPGKLNIEAIGSLSNATANTGYTVAQVYNSVELGNYAVPAGKAVNILGSGFFANEPITVATNRTTGSYSFDADSDGNLNDNGFVLDPSLAPGTLTLTITGEYSFTVHTITIYVQSPNA
jgi:hypothetical protein